MPDGLFAAAGSVAQSAFELALEQLGKSAVWKRRTTAVPNSGGDISDAYGHNDPQDDGAPLDPDDPDLYTSGGTILVWMNASTRDQVVAAGMIETGNTMGWVRADTLVADGDVLVVDGHRWVVGGVQVPTPGIYRELTLTRR